MKKFALAALAGGAMISFALPASAQTAPEDAPFSGVYVGGSFGYDVQPNDDGETIVFDRNLDGRYDNTVTTAAGANAFSPGFCNGRARGATPLPGGCQNDKDAIAYYGRVGADAQRGNIVVGVVGEFGKTEIRDSVSAFSTTPANYVFSRGVEWEAMGRGRAGYAADRTLFYGTAGVGYLKVKNRFTTTNTANSFTLNEDDSRWGFVFGGGIEQKLSRNVSVGLEYLGHQYSDNETSVRVGAGTAPATNPFILAPNATGTDMKRGEPDNFRWHSLRAVANFRF